MKRSTFNKMIRRSEKKVRCKDDTERKLRAEAARLAAEGWERPGRGKRPNDARGRRKNRKGRKARRDKPLTEQEQQFLHQLGMHREIDFVREYGSPVTRAVCGEAAIPLETYRSLKSRGLLGSRLVITFHNSIPFEE